MKLQNLIDSVSSLLEGVKSFTPTEYITFSGDGLLNSPSEESQIRGLNLLTKRDCTVTLDGEYTCQQLKLIASTMEAIQAIEINYE